MCVAICRLSVCSYLLVAIFTLFLVLSGGEKGGGGSFVIIGGLYSRVGLCRNETGYW